MSHPENDDDIVISGISGRYPLSSNIDEFWDNLMSGVEMSTIDDSRWPVGFMQLPKRTGKIPDADKFDASFFKVADNEANWMDPQVRKFHETTFEAILDSGHDPTKFNGSKTGVYIGSCSNDSEKALKEDESHVADIIQNSATAVSLALGLKGMSINVDTACASSFTAFHEAFLSMKSGINDSAIVGGWCINLKPLTAQAFQQLSMTSDDGRSKCMDASADGYCRSEAIVSILLQKRSAAKRNYATISNVRTNCDGFKVEGITFPSIALQTRLMEETYGEIGLDPANVDYVEAHMTGTAAGDPVESAAIANVLCRGRNGPLSIGCLKSNMGHSEGASGLCAITKSCLAFQRRMLPPNLHLNKINENIESLVNGQLEPVLKERTFFGSTIALNCFGFGGCNVHAVIGANKNTLNSRNFKITSGVNRLITFCGRTKESLRVLEDMIKNKPEEVTADFCYLLQGVSNIEPESGFNHRAYFVLDNQRHIVSFKQLKIKERRPLVILSSASASLGSNCDNFNKFKPFVESKNKLVEIFSRFTDDEREVASTIFKLVSFQVALIDLLHSLEINPDYIIGTSIGEIAAAYADGCLSHSQVVEMCVNISLVLTNCKTDSSTAMLEILELMELSNQTRSSKWLPTAIPVTEWHQNVKLTAAYFARAVSGEVNLDQVFEYLPKNCIVIEMTPDPTIQKVLRTGLGPDVTVMSLGGTSDHILTILGDIYLSGNNLTVTSLYPKVKTPVARETASLSPLVKWNHDKSRLLTIVPDYFFIFTSNQYFGIDVMEPRYQHLTGHKIDGRILFPATGYLWIAWDCLARFEGHIGGDAGQVYLKVPVEFWNVQFRRATILPKQGMVKFNVQISTSTGQFAILEGGSVCVTGFAKLCPENPSTSKLEKLLQTKKSDNEYLQAQDIYKDLRVRGYDYGPSFQGLHEASFDGHHAKVKWLGDWVSFSDSVLQMAILSSNKRELLLPTSLDYLKCDIVSLVNEVDTMDNVVDVFHEPTLNLAATRGLFIRGLKASPAPRRQVQKPVVEIQKFIPHNCTFNLNNQEIEDYDKLCVQVSAKKFLGHGDKIDQAEMSRFLGNSRSLLLQMLDDTKSKEEFQELFKSSANISGDLLLSSFDFGLMVRTLLETVAENSNPKKMNILDMSFQPEMSTQISDLANKTMLEIVSSKLNKNEEGKVIFPSKEHEADVILVQHPSLDFSFSGKEKDGQDFETMMSKLVSVMKPGSFLLVMARIKKWDIENFLDKEFGGWSDIVIDQDVFDREFKKLGLVNIEIKRDSSTGIISMLARKPLKRDPSYIEMVTIRENNFEWVDELKEKLKTSDKDIWLVAEDSPTNGILGLVKTLRKEEGGHQIHCIYNISDGNKVLDENFNDKRNSFNVNELLEKNLVMNVVKDGQLGALRYLTVEEMRPKKKVKQVYLDVTTKGDLSSLTYYELPPSETMRTCVHFSALNFKDVMIASGRIPANAYPDSYLKNGNLGMEYSGIDSNGKRVMGLTNTNAIATHVHGIEDFTWTIPDHLSMRDATTIPVAYVTVYYALLIRGKLLRGESVLIHAGSGGVGQAAINVALSLGCNVFTTVGTRSKREFIHKNFPTIPDHQILNSRDVTFELETLRQTNGRGVDVILNSLAEDKMRASFRCLAEFGRFVEIGKYDICQNNPFDKGDFAENKSFQVVCLAHLIFNSLSETSSAIMTKRLKKMIQDGLNDGTVKPLSSHVFEHSCFEEAFRFMASGKHLGKVLLRMQPEPEVNNNVTLDQEPIEAVVKTYFDHNKSYIITGGLGGFGLELASWLIERGARKIILTSRSGINTAYQKLSMKRFQESGAHVEVMSHDVSDPDAARSLLDQSNNLAPLGGIFHLAMVLRDALFENQSIENFEEVCASKVSGTLNLDKLARNVSSLDHFVCFSSMVSGFGNAGQSNYSYANSAMDRICEHRKAIGLPGLAIQWGPVGDVGFVAEVLGGNDIEVCGAVPQRLQSCFDVLDSALSNPDMHPVVSSYIVSDSKLTSSNKNNLIDVIGHVLGVKDPSTLNPEDTLGDLGMDSLMAVEIRQALERDYDMTLTAQEVRSLTVAQIMSFKGPGKA